MLAVVVMNLYVPTVNVPTVSGFAKSIKTGVTIVVVVVVVVVVAILTIANTILKVRNYWHAVLLFATSEEDRLTSRQPTTSSGEV